MADFTVTVDGIVADGITERYTFQSGVEITLPLKFTPGGGTAYETRYDNVRELTRYANESTVRTGRTDDGIPWYRERVPTQASISTFLVDVDLGQRVQDIQLVPFWGVVLGGEDNSDANREQLQYNLDLFILAKLSEYADKTAASNEFESLFI